MWPTASAARPPGPAAQQPTGGLPKQPARAARPGQIAAQQPPVAAAIHIRPMDVTWIRRAPAAFGGIKPSCGQHPFETLKHFFPCLTHTAAYVGARGPQPVSAGDGNRAAPPGLRPAAALLSSSLCFFFLFLPLFP
jgi:hypothetical protein